MPETKPLSLPASAGFFMPMQDKVEQVAHAVTQGGAAVAGTAYATFSLGWWNENSAGVLAMAGVFGAGCSFIGLAVSWYYARKRAIR